MPPSAEPAEGIAPTGLGLAVAAEVLYLANLLVLPPIAFLILGVLFLRCDKDTPRWPWPTSSRPSRRACGRASCW